MAKGEYTLSEKEKRELLALGKEPYKMHGHTWVPLKGVGKNICKNCGLLMLRNRATEWCVDKGCNFSDHKDYEQAMKRLTKMRW